MLIFVMWKNFLEKNINDSIKPDFRKLLSTYDYKKYS